MALQKAFMNWQTGNNLTTLWSTAGLPVLHKYGHKMRQKSLSYTEIYKRKFSHAWCNTRSCANITRKIGNLCFQHTHTLGASTWPENRVRVEEMRNEFRIRSSMWKMINKPRGPYFTRWYRRVQCERVILKRGHFQVTYYMLIRLIWITYDIKNDSEMSLKL